MSKKNIVITVVIILILVLIGVCTYFLLKDNNNNNIDLTALNTSLEDKGHFSEMAMQDLDKDILASLYGIEDKEAIAEMIGKMPMMNVQASMYLVIKAADGKVDYIKTKLEEYAKNYENQWSMYLPDQYELVKSRELGVKGNYVYLIIAENAQELKDLIK